MSILVAGFLLKTAVFLARSIKFFCRSTVLYNLAHSYLLSVFLQQPLHQLLVPLLTCTDSHYATRILCYTVSLEDCR